MSVVAEEPVSTTSRASVVRAFFPTTTASTITNSRSTTNGLVSLVIDHQRGSNQRLGADTREPDGKTRVAPIEIADRLECLVIGGAMTNNAGRSDLGTTKRRMNDVDQADELIGIPRADLRPRQWLGRIGGESCGSIHTSIFPGPRCLSSFLTCNTSVDDGLGSLLPSVTARCFGAEQLAREARARASTNAVAADTRDAWQNFAIGFKNRRG